MANHTKPDARSNPPPPDHTRLTINLPTEKHTRLKSEAALAGKDIREVVEALIDEWLARR